jgi:RNA polymerase sigma-70 factor (ECF subfamily)
VDRVPLAPEEAFELELGLERELPALRAFLARLVRRSGGGDADDLAQEALARALRYRQSYDPRRPRGPWLRRAALRVFLAQRARQREAPRGIEDGQDSVACGRAGPREELSGREEVEHLLERLAPLERELLLRFHRGGESVRELARALGLPAGTVRSHLHRARRKLAATGRGDEGE